MVCRPAMPASWSSSTSVIRVSTTLAAAPIYWVWTETTGGSTSGYSRTDRPKKPTIPTTATSIATTAAKTGRFTERSESCIR